MAPCRSVLTRLMRLFRSAPPLLAVQRLKDEPHSRTYIRITARVRAHGTLLHDSGQP